MTDDLAPDDTAPDDPTSDASGADASGADDLAASEVPKAGRAPHEGEEVRIFTDGSCNTQTRDGGWAYLLLCGAHRKEAAGFEADTTNNRMELTAAVRALEALKRPCRVVLTTDSQYLRKAFTDGWLQTWQKNGWKTAGKSPVKNKDLWLKLLELSRQHRVEWRWTQGHAGQPENERVDKLALSARKRG